MTVITVDREKGRGQERGRSSRRRRNGEKEYRVFPPVLTVPHIFFSFSFFFSFFFSFYFSFFFFFFFFCSFPLKVRWTSKAWKMDAADWKEIWSVRENRETRSIIKIGSRIFSIPFLGLLKDRSFDSISTSLERKKKKKITRSKSSNSY